MTTEAAPELSFEEALTQLENIVRELESGRIRLDDAHDLFAGAPCDVKIVQQCIAIDFRPGAGGWRKRFHSASLKSLGISPYFQQ